MKNNNTQQYLKGSSPWYFIAAILAVLIVLGGLIFYLVYIPHDLKEPEPEQEKSEIEKQLEELESLRENTEPLTEEEVQEQLEELEDLRQNTEPLTEEEIQKQLEELEKLRNQ